MKPACKYPNGRTVPAQAAFDNGGVVTNALWGFMFNSVPFGMKFEDHMWWLNSDKALGNGMTPLQYIHKMSLDADGVVGLPVLGGPRQMSGMFKKDMGESELGQLCQSGWVFRYLPPPQNILQGACENLIEKKVIDSMNITFVASIPGVSVLGGVQRGDITAFEFASAIDNYNASTGGFFVDMTDRDRLDCTKYTPQSNTCAQNPGHKGLVHMHYPAWHQPFFGGYMIINQSVWESLSEHQRLGIKKAAEEAVYETFYASNMVECELVQKQLDFNNGEVQLNIDGSVKDCNPDVEGVQACSADITLASWSKKSLKRLKKATWDFFDDIRTAMSQKDRDIFNRLIKSYFTFAEDNCVEWKPEAFPCDCYDN